MSVISCVHACDVWRSDVDVKHLSIILHFIVCAHVFVYLYVCTVVRAYGGQRSALNAFHSLYLTL